MKPGDAMISVRFSDEEYARFNALARSKGLSPTALVRRLVEAALSLLDTKEQP